MKNNFDLDKIIDNALVEFGALTLLIFGSILGLATLALIDAPDLIVVLFIFMVLWTIL